MKTVSSCKKKEIHLYSLMAMETYGLVKDELLHGIGGGQGRLYCEVKPTAAPAVITAAGGGAKSVKRRKREPSAAAMSAVTVAGNGKEAGGSNAANKRSSRFRGVSRYSN